MVRSYCILGARLHGSCNGFFSLDQNDLRLLLTSISHVEVQIIDRDWARMVHLLMLLNFCVHMYSRS
jgi:hypothetical protein